MNNRQKGSQWEEIAAEYLTAQGMRIVERNFRDRQGEIDLIGYHMEYLVFVEVKYRKNGDKGDALEAVGFRKQRQISRVSDFYRMKHGIGENTLIRFDVVGIQAGEVEWIKNAFPYVYTRG